MTLLQNYVRYKEDRGSIGSLGLEDRLNMSISQYPESQPQKKPKECLRLPPGISMWLSQVKLFSPNKCSYSGRHREKFTT